MLLSKLEAEIHVLTHMDWPGLHVYRGDEVWPINKVPHNPISININSCFIRKPTF